MSLTHSPLGQATPYVQHYDASLLFPIARAANRATLSAGITPASGVDLWTAYELSWLNARGKPVVATATFSIPASSPNIVESKSFKLYLNSLNQSAFESPAAVRDILVRDISTACGAPVEVGLDTPDRFSAQTMRELDGICLDDQDIDITGYTPDPELLTLATTPGIVEETLVSHLLKSNCPVTNQPDWASVQISYRGAAIDHAQLLRYVVSYRQHAGFHEHCVEQMFDDIMRRCQPEWLTVYARYTRRGGLDINPWRSSREMAAPSNIRTARQ